MTWCTEQPVGGLLAVGLRFKFRRDMAEDCLAPSRSVSTAALSGVSGTSSVFWILALTSVAGS